MSDNDERTPAEEAAVRHVLSDRDLVWEAIGPDGITYDFNTNTLRMDDLGRISCQTRMASVDDAIAAKLAYLISVNDYEAIGELVCDQVNGYLGHRFTEVAEEVAALMEASDRERKERMES